MKRESRITVTFTHPFQLKGIDRTLPPGDYTILTEEELTNDNASFPVYHESGGEPACRTRLSPRRQLLANAVIAASRVGS